MSCISIPALEIDGHALRWKNTTCFQILPTNASPRQKVLQQSSEIFFQQSLPQFTNDYYWVLFRKKSVPLCLSESYFYNMHLLSPYFANLVLNRLKDAYISPQIEMQTDTAFFRICTVSTIKAPFGLLKKPSLIFPSLFLNVWLSFRNLFEFLFRLFLNFPSNRRRCVLVGVECTTFLKNFCLHTTTVIGTLLWKSSLKLAALSVSVHLPKRQGKYLLIL